LKTKKKTFFVFPLKMRLYTVFVQRRDDHEKIHPCIVQFDKLTPSEKQYNLSLAQEMLR